MGTANYPTVAGNDALTICEATFTIDGVKYVGVETFKWTNGLEGVEPVYGASREPISETSGTYKPSCEFELNYISYRNLCKRLGQNYMDKRFNIVVNLRGSQSGLSTLTIPRARIIEDSGSLERGKNIVIPVKCSVLGRITMDGMTAIPGVATAGNNFGSGASAVASVTASFGISV